MKTTLYCPGAHDTPEAIQYDQASGAWVEHDTKGRPVVNVLLELTTGKLQKQNAAQTLIELLPDLEIRVGLWASVGAPEELSAWKNNRTSEVALALADAQATHMTEQGCVRNLKQYLWVRTKVAQGGHTPITDSRDELLSIVQGALNYIQVGSKPVTNWKEVIGSYDEPGAHVAEQPDCDILVEQSLGKPTPLTAYLQAPDTTQRVSIMVDDLFTELEGGFQLWGTWLPLPAAGDMKARQLVRSELRWMLSPVSDKRMLSLIDSAEFGSWGLFKWMLTLPDETSEDAQRARHLAHNVGVRLMPTAMRWLGLFSYPKDFLVTLKEAGECLPLIQSVTYADPSASGLMLLNAQGAPAILNPFEGYSTFNVMITGKAGSGKDFVGRAMVEAHIASGKPAWVIESFENANALCELYGGRQVAFDSSATGLTPLAMVTDLDSELPLLVDWLQVLLPLPAALPEYSRFRLEKALMRAFEAPAADAVTLADVHAALKKMGDPLSLELAGQLNAYLQGGEYGNVFSGSPVDLGSEGLTFLRPNTKDHKVNNKYSATLAVMLSLHWKRLPVSTQKLAFLSDTEYWADTSDAVGNTEAFGRLTHRILRTARKHNGGWITAVNDYYLANMPKESVASAMLEMSSWHILQSARPEKHLVKHYPIEILDLWHKSNTRRGMAKFVVLSPYRAPALMCLLPGDLLQAALTTKWKCGVEYLSQRSAGKTPLEAIRSATSAL